MKLFVVAPVDGKLTEDTTLVWANNTIKFAAMQGISAIPLLGKAIKTGGGNSDSRFCCGV